MSDKHATWIEGKLAGAMFMNVGMLLFILCAVSNLQSRPEIDHFWLGLTAGRQQIVTAELAIEGRHVIGDPRTGAELTLEVTGYSVSDYGRGAFRLDWDEVPRVNVHAANAKDAELAKKQLALYKRKRQIAVTPDKVIYSSGDKACVEKRTALNQFEFRPLEVRGLGVACFGEFLHRHRLEEMIAKRKNVLIDFARDGDLAH